MFVADVGKNDSSFDIEDDLSTGDALQVSGNVA